MTTNTKKHPFYERARKKAKQIIKSTPNISKLETVKKLKAFAEEEGWGWTSTNMNQKVHEHGSFGLKECKEVVDNLSFSAE